MRILALVSCLAGAIVLLCACGSDQATQAREVTQTASTSASTAGGRLRLVKVATVSQPIAIGSAPGDASRLYVAQKGGQIELLLNGKKQSRPFLDIGGAVNSDGGEQGLLGLAFPKNYAASGLFYVDYTLADNDIRIEQFHRSASNANLADPASGRTVLTIGHHAFTNHDGGQLAFGPDGFLYVGVGDGGSENDPDNNGQSTSTLLAKILRLDPSPGGGYTIPSGNPFAGKPGKRAEIWAYGLRNPWRFSFDRLTGALIIGDVGQDQEEEIDYAARGASRGANYGWSVWEGTRRNKSGKAPKAVFPKLVASHSQGYCAIIGGYVVRDHALPALYDRYLFSDNCRPQIESVKLGRGRATGLHAIGLSVNGASSFGEDARGHIYIASLEGPVYRLVQG